MQDFSRELADKYCFEIKSITPFRDTYILESSQGKKILKKSDLSHGRILFVHGAKEHLYRNNFVNLDRYICTSTGEPFVIIDGITYTTVDAVDGRECNFDDNGDIINASIQLAHLHKCSRGYVPPQDCFLRNDLGTLTSVLNKRLDEMKKIKKYAMKGNTKFDYLVLEYINYFYNLGESAINMLLESKYDELVSLAKAEGGFCHHELTHGNIIFSKEKVYMINFDFCSFELRVYDIVNLLRRKMRKCNWDINQAKMIINEYRSIGSISEDEFGVMRVMLKFPQKFWRIINRYYNSRKTWSQKYYIFNLQEVISEIPYNKCFIDKFEMLI